MHKLTRRNLDIVAAQGFFRTVLGAPTSQQGDQLVWQPAPEMQVILKISDPYDANVAVNGPVSLLPSNLEIMRAAIIGWCVENSLMEVG